MEAVSDHGHAMPERQMSASRDRLLTKSLDEADRKVG